MRYQTFSPPPQLAPYVRCFWVYEGEASASAPFVHRSYADGCAELVFNYRGLFDQLFDGRPSEKSWAAGLHGQSTAFTRFEVRENFGLFGTYLYPYAIPKLFSFSATELTGQLPDLYELFGRAGSELEERVMLSINDAERVRIVSEFLLARLCQVGTETPAVFSSVAAIVRRNGLVNVPSLAEHYNSSTRTFERKFKEATGLAPKLFARLVRFQMAVKEYPKPKRALTDIAYDLGYYDQSHFIHEFREFSGYNPKEFFSGRAEGADYLEV